MKWLLYIFLTAALMGCSTSPSTDEPQRPGSDTPVQPDNPKPKPDYTAQTADATFRFTGMPGCEMRYDDGGVLFITDDRSGISGYNLTSGRNFRFDPATASLTADGTQIHLSSAEKIAETETTVWYRLTSPRLTEALWLVAPR